MADNNKSLIERIYRSEWKEPTLTFHEILRRMYIDRNLSIRDISDEIGISVGAVHKYLKDECIEKNLKCRF